MTAQERPALPADPTADDLAIAALTDERDDYAARLRATAASWAVVAAERDDLAQQCDKLRALLDDFTHAVIDLDARGAIVKAAHAVRKKAGMTVIDQFSKPADESASARDHRTAGSGADNEERH